MGSAGECWLGACIDCLSDAVVGLGHAVRRPARHVFDERLAVELAPGLLEVLGEALRVAEHGIGEGDCGFHTMSITARGHLTSWAGKPGAARRGWCGARSTADRARAHGQGRGRASRRRRDPGVRPSFEFEHERESVPGPRFVSQLAPGLEVATANAHDGDLQPVLQRVEGRLARAGRLSVLANSDRAPASHRLHLAARRDFLNIGFRKAQEPASIEKVGGRLLLALSPSRRKS